MSELTAAEEKIKKAIAGQVEKSVEELHNGYLVELEAARDKMSEDYKEFLATHDAANLAAGRRIDSVEKRIGELESGKPSGFLFEGFIPVKNRVRFMDGQRKAAAGIAGTKSGREAQKIAYVAADALIDCMDLEDKAPRRFHLDKYELAGVVLGGALVGAVGVVALATKMSRDQLKKHGRTAADLDAWLKRKPITTESEVADNVVALEPARAAAMAKMK